MAISPDDDESLTSGFEDALRAALDESSGGDKGDPEPEAKATEQPAASAADPETDDGAQQPKEKEPVEADADPAAQEQQESDVKAEEDGDGSDDADPEPLKTWNVEQKQLFDGIEDKKARRLVLDRFKFLDKKANEKFQDIARQRKELDEGLTQVQSYERAVKPYEQMLASVNMTPAAAAGQIMALWKGLNDDPVGSFGRLADEFIAKRGGSGTPLASEAVRQIARRLNVDLSGLDDLDAQADDDRRPDTRETELITQLRDRIDQLEGKFTSTQQQALSSQAQVWQNEWQKFASDPENGHAERLRNTVIAYADSPQAQHIHDPRERFRWAYERAVLTDDEAKAEWQERERSRLYDEWKAEQGKLRQQNSAAVRRVSPEKAKAASTTPKPSAPVAVVNSHDKDVSWKQAFAADADEIFGGGASRV